MNTPEEIATLNARLAAWLAADKAKHAAALAAQGSTIHPSQEKQVAALRAELDAANARLDAVAEILRNCERSGIEAFHDSLTAALYRNSL